MSSFDGLGEALGSKTLAGLSLLLYAPFFAALAWRGALDRPAGVGEFCEELLAVETDLLPSDGGGVRLSLLLLPSPPPPASFLFAAPPTLPLFLPFLSGGGCETG